MSGMSRREFLGKTGGASAALAFMAASGIKLHANPLGLPIGSQTYPHLARIQSGDLAGLLKDMKAIGIEQIELCSPGYTQFKSLADGKQTRKILDDNGMKAVSAHFTMPEYRNQNGFSHQKAIEWAHDVGLNQMSTASVLGKVTNGMTTLEEVKRACDEYNKIGAITKAGGSAADHPPRRLRELADRRRAAHVSRPARILRPRARQNAVSDVVDADRRRSDHVLHQPPRPICLDASAGRGRHARNAGVSRGHSRAEADAGADCRSRGGARRARGRRRRARGAGGRGGNPGLAVGEDNVDWVKVFQAAKIGGVKNVFRRAELGFDGQERRVFEGTHRRVRPAENPDARRCAHDRHRGA